MRKIFHLNENYFSYYMEFLFHPDEKSFPKYKIVLKI